jgi:hypothetical protein
VAPQYHRRLAVLLVSATIAATWFLSGVAISEAARFVVFEAFYVVLPGCLLYRVLSSDPGGRLRTLAIGWPLGYAIEVGAFALSAAVDKREAFAFLPLVSIALIAVLLKMRARPGRPTTFAQPSPRDSTQLHQAFLPAPLLHTALNRPTHTGSVIGIPRRTRKRERLQEVCRNIRLRAPIKMRARLERPMTFAEPCPRDSTWRHQAFVPASSLRSTLNRPTRTRILIGALRVTTQASSFASDESVLVAVAISATLTLLALQTFTFTPLPGHFHSVAYTAEQVFPISLAAEVRNHWPMTTPWVAGQPLRYYTAVFMHGAAINQVTGVGLSTVYLRLFPTTVTLLLALQLWSLGRSLGRSRFAGPLAVVLVFLAGTATLEPTKSWPFECDALPFFWGSATFPFGALFLLALLSLIQSWLSNPGTVTRKRAIESDESRRQGHHREVIIVAILVLCCGASKMFAAVDFVGGLGLFWLWSVATKRVSSLLSYSLAASIICLGVIYFFMLAGGGAKLVGIRLLNTTFTKSLPTQVREIAPALIGHSALWILFFVGAMLVVIACLSAPALGVIWLLLRRRAFSSFEVLCLAVFLAGFAGYYTTFGSSQGAEIYFRIYGYYALILIAAGGLADLWSETPKNARRAIINGCGVVLIVGLAITGGSHLLALTGQAERLWYMAMCGLVGGVVFLVALRLSKRYAPVIFSRFGRVVACCIPLLGVLGFVRPVTYATVRAKATIFHQRIASRDSPATYGMTAALYRGLIWVRAHTRACNVLAVNNHYDDSASFGDTSAYMYYSAFTERRIFLESWGFSPTGRTGGQPFPGRLTLNDSAVLRGNPVALGELGREGVSYVLLDKTHGGGAREPSSLSRLVFSNSALDVYRLLTVANADHRLGCGAGT